MQTQVSSLNGDKAMWKQNQSGLLAGAKENRGQLQCSLVPQPCQTLTKPSKYMILEVRMVMVPSLPEDSLGPDLPHSAHT